MNSVTRTDLVIDMANPREAAGRHPGHTEINGGLQAKMIAAIGVEGSERPAVVAESLIRAYA